MTGFRTLARSTTLVVVAVCGLASTTAAGQRREQPELDAVLDKAAAYVQRFVARFSNVVAEERYTQERFSPGRKTRTLVSDYFLTSLPGSNDWLELRDVVEVDGKPVGDRENRLLGLVSNGTSGNWADRARAVARESARYNIEDIGTINRPLVAMALLQAPYRGRVIFTLAPVENKLDPDRRMIRFRETNPPSMFNVGFVSGNIWVSETTGVVLKTELQFGNNRDAVNHVVTTFSPDADLGVSVPATMEDAYAFQGSGGLTEIRGRATYGRFRRFGVKTEEEIR